MSENIGANIKEWRTLRGMKQAELAEMIGITSQAISSWERGRTEPNMGMVEALCAALKCKKSDIIGGVDYDDTYYYDRDVRDMAQLMRDNPSYRVLFDACRAVKPEDIKRVARMIKAYGDDSDGGY